VNTKSDCDAKGHGVAKATQAVCGLVLLLSSWGHFQNPFAFYAAMSRYEIATGEYALALTYLLPSLHLLTGVSLILQLNQPFASRLCCGLLCLYLVVQVSAVVRKLEIDCGFFGVLHSQQVGFTSLAQTAVILTLLLMSTFALKRTWR
jgi:hypothetical protein